MSGIPSPFVYWAQDAKNLYIKVDLKDVTDKVISLESYSLEMGAEGVGAHGNSYYHFKLDFYDGVIKNEKKNTIKLTDRAIEFTLQKQNCDWWPRITKTKEKPAWLKIDFERWQSEDDDEDMNDSNMYKRKDIHGDYPGLYEKLKKDEFGYRKDMKKVYLVLYNLSQFVFFMYIFVVLTIRYAKDGVDSMEGTYEAVGPALKFCQLIQFLEVMHPMFGYTKGSVFIPFLQVGGRAIILFAMIDAEPRMQTKPVVFYLFLTWSIIEIVRYPYYIAQHFKVKGSYVLTWLRYSIWIPLYPLGILCEGIIILRNIPYFEETNKFSVSLPNSWNVSFHCPTVMKLYLLLLFFPGMYTMMKHMYRARIKKLGPSSWRNKFD
ncbi:3-hydroxyacyl-CoA dehydratase 2 isoform X2 [Lycorma delicatula]|uniref:3-hydroxyacyl-CoA dehydratase 2 isoform X2 n=1 Tax=Lycorma delicatula TaxID=130591 RepID=UPI003F510FAB